MLDDLHRLNVYAIITRGSNPTLSRVNRVILVHSLRVAMAAMASLVIA